MSEPLDHDLLNYDDEAEEMDEAEVREAEMNISGMITTEDVNPSDQQRPPASVHSDHGNVVHSDDQPIVNDAVDNPKSVSPDNPAPNAAEGQEEGAIDEDSDAAVNKGTTNLAAHDGEDDPMQDADLAEMARKIDQAIVHDVLGDEEARAPSRTESVASSGGASADESESGSGSGSSSESGEERDEDGQASSDGRSAHSSRASGKRKRRRRSRSRSRTCAGWSLADEKRWEKWNSPLFDSRDVRWFFNDARFFLIKSANAENVSLSKAKGVWATTAFNQRMLAQRFKDTRNVILVFSVERSGSFQGFARLASGSVLDASPVQWVLPPNMDPTRLGGIFRLQWLCRRPLPFEKTAHLFNPINENRPVKVGRDGTEIHHSVGKALCELFSLDETIDHPRLKRKAQTQHAAGEGHFKRPQKLGYSGTPSSRLLPNTGPTRGRGVRGFVGGNVRSNAAGGRMYPQRGQPASSVPVRRPIRAYQPQSSRAPHVRGYVPGSSSRNGPRSTVLASGRVGAGASGGRSYQHPTGSMASGSSVPRAYEYVNPAPQVAYQQQAVYSTQPHHYAQQQQPYVYQSTTEPNVYYPQYPAPVPLNAVGSYAPLQSTSSRRRTHNNHNEYERSHKRHRSSHDRSSSGRHRSSRSPPRAYKKHHREDRRERSSHRASLDRHHRETHYRPHRVKKEHF